jgi:hypothetical protein
VSHSCPICDAQNAIKLDEADRQRALLDCAKAANALSEWLEMYGWKDDDDYIKMRAALDAFVAAGGKLDD